MDDVFSPPLMACGHAANGLDKRGNPVCLICWPSSLSFTRDATYRDLTGRVAQCTQCPETEPSSLALSFFEYREGAPTDSFYCGCRGWE